MAPMAPMAQRSSSRAAHRATQVDALVRLRHVQSGGWVTTQQVAALAPGRAAALSAALSADSSPPDSDGDGTGGMAALLAAAGKVAGKAVEPAVRGVITSECCL